MTTQEFEQIARRMRPRLIELATGFFGDRPEAEDAAQEALLRLWLLRSRVGDSSHAEALLVRMTKNVCISEWRHRKMQVSAESEIRQSGRCIRLNGETDGEVADVQPMAESDNQRLLQLAISHLSPSEQQLFRMRHELDMDIAQIAAVTDMLPRSVSTVVSNARRKIIEQLKKGGIL